MITSVVRKTAPAEVCRLHGRWGKTEAASIHPKESGIVLVLEVQWELVPRKGAAETGGSGRNGEATVCSQWDLVTD